VQGSCHAAIAVLKCPFTPYLPDYGELHQSHSVYPRLSTPPEIESPPPLQAKMRRCAGKPNPAGGRRPHRIGVRNIMKHEQVGVYRSDHLPFVCAAAGANLSPGCWVNRCVCSSSAGCACVSAGIGRTRMNRCSAARPTSEV